MKFALAALIGAASAAECDCIGVDAVKADADAVTYTADTAGEFATFLQDTANNYYNSDTAALETGTDYGATYGDSCANWDAEQTWCDGADDEWCEWGYAWCYVDPDTCTTDLGGEVTEYFDGTDYSGATWYDCSEGYGSFSGYMGDNIGMTLFLLLIFPIGVPVLMVKAMKFTAGPGWTDGTTL